MTLHDLPSPLPSPPVHLQDLPPVWAHFCLRIERFLLDTVPGIRDQRILLACSAGSDSLALLLAMRFLARRLNADLTVVHLNHGLRPESAQEASFLKQFCTDAKIPILTGATNVSLYARKTGQGIEEAARNLRYGFLFGMRKKLKANLVMTAHHADDLAEDIVMRLVRGTGWPGLAGMPAWDRRRCLARPLLYTPKQTLRDFLLAMGVSWREDATNAVFDRLRNRIRGMVLPHLHQEQPHLHRNLTRIHTLGVLDQDYFSTLLRPLVHKARLNDHCLLRQDLDGMHPALRLRLFKAVLDDLGPNQIRNDALFRLEQAWKSKRIGACIQFSGRKTAMVNATGVQFMQISSALRGTQSCD